LGKIAEKAVCRSVIFDNMALYFECRMNKKHTPSDCFFGDFSHWEVTPNTIPIEQYVLG